MENEFLGNLEENQVEALVSAMYPKQIPANTLVIREGDIGMYILTFIYYHIKIETIYHSNIVPNRELYAEY